MPVQSELKWQASKWPIFSMSQEVQAGTAYIINFMVYNHQWVTVCHTDSEYIVLCQLSWTTFKASTLLKVAWVAGSCASHAARQCKTYLCTFLFCTHIMIPKPNFRVPSFYIRCLVSKVTVHGRSTWCYILSVFLSALFWYFSPILRLHLFDTPYCWIYDCFVLYSVCLTWSSCFGRGSYGSCYLKANMVLYKCFSFDTEKLINCKLP